MLKLLFPYLLIPLALCSCLGNNTTPEAGGLIADTVPEIPEFPKIEIIIEKALTYDKYTLADSFSYRDDVRVFQWDKIRDGLARLDTLLVSPAAAWGILQNRNNKNGEAPLVKSFTRNDFRNIQDAYGVERRQGTPLYDSVGAPYPTRYGEDGSLVKLYSAEGDSLEMFEAAYIRGVWYTPARYVKRIESDSLKFDHAIFVDRTNQCIATLERVDGKWLVRSMNPATTGLHRPPYQHETPLGIFVIQEKKPRMLYLVDGTSEIGGFSPYASRFSNGGYIHGVPVNLPATAMIEYSASLGTTPRSHKCVRNATSHAKFIYDNFPTEQTLVFVIE